MNNKRDSSLLRSIEEPSTKKVRLNTSAEILIDQVVSFKETENEEKNIENQEFNKLSKKHKGGGTTTNFQPLIISNNRRRMSSGAGGLLNHQQQQRRVNMRDPLGLESVQPDEQPKNGEDKKEMINNNVAIVDEQQQRGGAGGKRKRKEDQQHSSQLLQQQSKQTSQSHQQQRYSSPVSKKSHPSIIKKSKNEQKDKEDNKNKLIDDLNKNDSIQINNEEKKKRRQNMTERYRYGNFNNYHMKKEFRNNNSQFHHSQQQQTSQQSYQPSTDYLDDPRVNFFCPDWFYEKTILDLGCNAGRFAITLARRYQPRKVIGIDLDQHLIGAARKNIRHYADKDAKLINKFPASFPANFGPISAPSTSSGSKFPDNIWFFCENYVLKSDEELEKVKEEFEIIFALSLTKWIHLNWGDNGIRRFFHRAFRQLKTGGRFVLETAPYKDYIKHCNKKGGDKPPEEVLNNLTKIKFHPEEFTEYLLNIVGFNHHEELNTPQSKHLGISGRLQVFYKGKFMLTPRRGGEIDLIVNQEKQQNNNTQQQQLQQSQQTSTNGTTKIQSPQTSTTTSKHVTIEDQKHLNQEENCL